MSYVIKHDVRMSLYHLNSYFYVTLILRKKKTFISFQTIPGCYDPEEETFENTVRKGENANYQYYLSLLLPIYPVRDKPFPINALSRSTDNSLGQLSVTITRLYSQLTRPSAYNTRKKKTFENKY